MQYLSFRDWLISLSIMSSRFIHIAACVNFLPFEGWIIFHCMYRPGLAYLFIHRRTLSCFCLLPVVNNAAGNIGVQIFVQVPAFSSSGCIPRSGMAGSYGNSIFNFLRRHDFCIWFSVSLGLCGLDCMAGTVLSLLGSPASWAPSAWF